MKPSSHPLTLKNFSALSFDRIETKATALPTQRAPRTRLAPKSAGDFNVQSDGPANADPADVAGRETHRALSPASGASKPARVLVVDDERNIRVQRTLTPLTRPLTCANKFGPGHPRGGIND